MIENLPRSQVEDAHSLTSTGYRDLYKIELRNADNTVLYINAYNPVEFMGQQYENLPCTLTEASQNTTGEQSRPKFTIVNPDGLFSLFIQRGALDGAILTRYRVLTNDLELNNGAFARNLWIISKVVALNKAQATFELRSSMDGVNYMLPARSFYPPAFPHVSLR